MKNFLYTILGVSCLTTVSLADDKAMETPKSADATTMDMTKSAEHFALSIKDLKQYEILLKGELHDAVKAGDGDDKIMGIAQNIMDIQKAMHILNAMHHIHVNEKEAK